MYTKYDDSDDDIRPEGSIAGKLIGALLFLAGFIILFTSCRENGVNMSAGSLLLSFVL